MDAEGSTRVSWERYDPREPVVARVPYVELKLEHPSLDASRVSESFFPDAVPYQCGDEHRVFYWQAVLPAAAAVPSSVSSWRGACATTHALHPLTDGDGVSPRVWSRRDGHVEVVVDGTVAGHSQTTVLTGYTPPAIGLRELDAGGARVVADGDSVAVARGSRRTIAVSRRRATTADDDHSVTVSPELSVRYPGERTLYHPMPDSGTALFPGFGLDLDCVPNPVAVPTTHGELDYTALADVLGVDLTARPYAERVLWQAFAHTAFDPHRVTEARLGQTDAGLLVVGNPARD